jgi:hypothetical protein
MALSDVLPDRPLTPDEFDELQGSDTFDEVRTGDSSEEYIDTITVTMNGEDHMLHFAPQGGWHKHEHGH